MVVWLVWFDALRDIDYGSLRNCPNIKLWLMQLLTLIIIDDILEPSFAQKQQDSTWNHNAKNLLDSD